MAVRASADETSGTSGRSLVDALNHLAVNLLLVIAVLGLVVLGTSLPIVEQFKRETRLSPTPAATTPAGATELTLAELQDELRVAQANFKATQARLVETQRRVQHTAAVQSPSFSLASTDTEELAAPTEPACGTTPLPVPATPQSGSVCQADQRVPP